ncbi:MAG: hypothetical protein sL5_00530 [Candidatus Mesenet longicola]|uniref:Uncharacterized protein n=1 Tax=Candidatus Mesenet longicola TaxID=1892558 RepID=A0A8J3MNN1_9RICK|nr:MAG: hypothetical protein sGL2_00430 [Candidatus Mesenet longicola]GHM59060.1 MAG: hypothetical protein sL5_00530 [Candidatus Mesenet longicola]
MVKDKKEKLEVIKEEPKKEEREELSEELSKAAEDAMKDNNYKELGKIVKTAETNQITISANIENAADNKKSR